MGRVGWNLSIGPPTANEAYDGVLDRCPDLERPGNSNILPLLQRDRCLSLKEMSLAMAMEKAHRLKNEVMQEVDLE
jgi:hypothetical protein